MRTAEVTICIIPRGLLDRPRQLPHAWRPKIVEDNVQGVIAQGIEGSAVPRANAQPVVHDVREIGK